MNLNTSVKSKRKDNDWLAINQKIYQAKIAWARLGKILVKDKASVKAMSSVYSAVAKK
jgi:hypothetical protein